MARRRQEDSDPRGSRSLGGDRYRCDIVDVAISVKRGMTYIAMGYEDNLDGLADG
jgi:hypothetical protein